MNLNAVTTSLAVVLGLLNAASAAYGQTEGNLDDLRNFAQPQKNGEAEQKAKAAEQKAKAAEQKLSVERKAREDAEKRAAEAERRAAELERKQAAQPKAEPPVAAGESRKTGEVFKDCSDCPEMLVIPAGSFTMGSPDSEAGRDADEGPQHRVTIGQAFALGRYEVTVGEFRAFVQATNYRTDAENNAGGLKGCRTLEEGKWDDRKGRFWNALGFAQSARQPVACISWNDARAYVKWLGVKTGQTYRLPSEAEWEYAARAGTTTSRFWGNDPEQACKYANVADSSKDAKGRGWGDPIHNCSDGNHYSAPVGSYAPNAFGLKDMTGNVWEWAEDCSNINYKGAPADGRAWTNGNCASRVLRGGSWLSDPTDPQNTRTAFRDRAGEAYRSNDSGFRVARMLP